MATVTKTKVEIYRFGNYIATVENKKNVLRRWIISNCPNNKEGEDIIIPLEKNLEECLDIAKEQHYEFKVISEEQERPKIPLYTTMQVIEKVSITEVARAYGELEQKGTNYVLKTCPSCGGEHVVAISPKHKIFRCFRCGRNGDVIRFVQDTQGLTFDQAIEYLKDNFIKK